MSVKPVDLQASVPKSGEVGRIAKKQQDEGQARLTELARAFKGEVERSRQRVRTAPRTNGARIERDGQGGRQPSGEWREDETPEKKQGGGADGEPAVDPRKGGLIDILL